MSKSIKFRNDIYLDASSISYLKQPLTSYLSRYNNLYAMSKASDDATSVTFRSVNDETNMFDRRLYMYMWIGNGCSCSFGFITLNNGVLQKQYHLGGTVTPVITGWEQRRLSWQKST